MEKPKILLDKSGRKIVERPGKKLEIFLDSGAFSALTQGTQINLDEYMAFIFEHLDILTVYANLDVIGNAEATMKNQEIMEEQGLTPLPCYHYGEPQSFLNFYVQHYDYVALGGIAIKRDKDRLIAWLCDCFDFICDTPNRLPKVKVHGFGLTAVDLMLMFPWYSVDSTSWVLEGSFGTVNCPRWSTQEKKWVYSGVQVLSYSVSDENPSVKGDTKNAHFRSLAPEHKKEVLRYLDWIGVPLGESSFRWVPKNYKLQLGEFKALPDLDKSRSGGADEMFIGKVIIPGISNDYCTRNFLNVLFYKKFAEEVRPWPWFWRRQGRVAKKLL